jgi:hypothetical protein
MERSVAVSAVLAEQVLSLENQHHASPVPSVLASLEHIRGLML